MSTYTDFITEPNSAKQTLVELDIGEDSIFINYQPGIWYITYSVDKEDVTYNFGAGAFGYGNFGSAGVADLTNDKARERIGSVIVDGEQYLRTTNLTNLRANNKSFYFKIDDSLLFMHFDNFNPPECFGYIEIGITHGYALQAKYYDDIYYDARIISIPNIVKRKDPLFFGLIRFEGGSIQLINDDGEFDNFANLNIFGQSVRILFGGLTFAYTDFETVFAGTVEDFTFQNGRVTINIQDKRKALSRKIPINYYDSTTYPDIKTHNAGKPIPLGYGVIKNAPVICNNEEEGGSAGVGTYNFKIVDTTNYAIQAITQVYVDDIGQTHGGENLTNATFTLSGGSAGVYTPRNKVSVDFQGYQTGGALIDNGLDIIKDLMAIYTDTAYNSINYDTTEWANERNDVKDMCLFIEKEKSLIDIITDICKSIPGSMIAQDDGIWTFKIRNVDKARDREIKHYELIEAPTVTYESDEYLSSVLVEYNKDWKNNEYETEIDTSEENAIFKLYKEKRQRTFETLLVSESDAETFATAILDVAGGIDPLINIKTKTQNINLELEDLVDAEVDKYPDGTYGYRRCEVVGIEKDLTEYQVALSLKHVAYDYETLTLGLIGYWALNEGSGDSAADSSGYGNTGTLEGDAPTWVDGISGKAVNFPGTNERIDCGNSAPLDDIGNGDFSISFWMKSKDEVPLNYGRLFVKRVDGDNRIGLMSNATNNQLILIIQKGGVGMSTVFSADFTPFDTEFNHIVLVINRTTDFASLYMNAVKDSTEIDISSCPADCSNAANVSWGATHEGLAPYEGYLDELRIYNRVLIEDEISNLYNYPSGTVTAKANRKFIK